MKLTDSKNGVVLTGTNFQIADEFNTIESAESKFYQHRRETLCIQIHPNQLVPHKLHCHTYLYSNVETTTLIIKQTTIQQRDDIMHNNNVDIINQAAEET